MMTPQEQRIALAEWDGWTNVAVRLGTVSGFVPDSEMLDSQGAKNQYFEIPDYDLNAVHELEVRLIKKGAWYPAIKSQLEFICTRDWKKSNTKTLLYIEFATAAQRREALCRVLFPERWKD